MHIFSLNLVFYLLAHVTSVGRDYDGDDGDDGDDDDGGGDDHTTLLVKHNLAAVHIQFGSELLLTI